MKSLLDALVPRPQKLELTGSGNLLPTEISIGLSSDHPLLEHAGARLQKVLATLQVPCRIRSGGDGGDDFVRIRVEPETSLPPQGYRLRATARGIDIAGIDHAGALYGALTLAQCLVNAESVQGSIRLPDLEVIDWPDVPVRGVLLDISRDRVPTMETIFGLVDLLAGWKINQFQLYTEHTFAYRGHERVWQAADPLTPEEARELDRFCAVRGIDLVPNQNSFGHLHRWLVHEPYRRLAECPQGLDHPFSDEPEPFSLCPIDPAALDLLADLYDQLLPCFASPLFNVGFDETFDLGLGRSATACEERGKDRVYLEFLHEVHDLVKERGRRMQFWADMVIRSPAMLEQLPSDIIALEWGYEADHPFMERSRALSAAGLDFYLCPGTSSWNSLAGRIANAIGNLASAALCAREAGASGYLITDWGDCGHLQPLTVSYPGLLAGAAFAWNTSTAREVDHLLTLLPGLLDLHAFARPASGLGLVVVDLGQAYRQTGIEVENASVLFHLLRFPDRSLHHPRFRDLAPAGLNQARQFVEESLARLDRIVSPSPASDLAARELRWVAEMLRFACALGLSRCELAADEAIAALPLSTRDRLFRTLMPLIEEYGVLWRARSRPGGFLDSVRRLERIRDLLRPR